MSKYNKHQIGIILLMVNIIGYLIFKDIQMIEILQLSGFMQDNMLLTVSFIFILTLGVSHGALDGKIIWSQGGNLNNKIKIFFIYAVIVALGWALWTIYPFFSLIILLSISIFHFGSSDLQFLEEINKLQKLSWGFLMTFMPIAFHDERVNNIFFQITNDSFNIIALSLIKYSLFLAVFIYLYSIGKAVFLNKDKLSYILSIIELITLLLLAYFLDPIVWFALYFCALHGIRSIIYQNFKWYPDFLWIIFFTSPVIIFVIIMENYYLGDVMNNNFFIVFPILACLTNAHMMLPKIIKKLKY